MNKKTFVSIAMLMVLTLSVVGFTYAFWVDQITVSGDIEVGSLNLAWVELGSEPWQYRDNEGPGKDYADGWVTYHDPETDCYTGNSGYQKIVLHVENAYPGLYTQFRDLTLGNIGSTPLDLDLNAITIVGEDLTNGEVLKFKWLQGPGIEPSYGVLYFDEDGDDQVDPEIDDGDGIIDPSKGEYRGEERIWFHTTFFGAGQNWDHGRQIHEDGFLKEEIDFYWLQPIYECHHYQVTITIYGVQWNWNGVPYSGDFPQPPTP